MLSRVADSLYWMSRYIERAENVGRFVDVNLNLMLDSPVGLMEQWGPLIQITATGDEDGGRVTIDLGDRVLEIVGDDEGGHLEVTDGSDAEATAADEGAAAGSTGDTSTSEEPSAPQ